MRCCHTEEHMFFSICPTWNQWCHAFCHVFTVKNRIKMTSWTSERHFVLLLSWESAEFEQSNPMVSNETLHLVVGSRSSNTPTSLPKRLTNTLRSLDLCRQQVNRYKTKERGLFDDRVGSCRVFEWLQFCTPIFVLLTRLSKRCLVSQHIDSTGTLTM